MRIRIRWNRRAEQSGSILVHSGLGTLRVTTIFRVWLWRREFPHPRVPDWNASGATILNFESIAAQGWDVTVRAQDRETFKKWLDAMVQQDWVWIYTILPGGSE